MVYQYCQKPKKSRRSKKALNLFIIYKPPYKPYWILKDKLEAYIVVLTKKKALKYKYFTISF